MLTGKTRLHFIHLTSDLNVHDTEERAGMEWGLTDGVGVGGIWHGWVTASVRTRHT